MNKRRRQARTSLNENESLPHSYVHGFVGENDGDEELAGKTRPMESKFVPKSLSLAEMIKLGKLGSPSQTTAIKINSFDLESLVWA